MDASKNADQNAARWSGKRRTGMIIVVAVIAAIVIGVVVSVALPPNSPSPSHTYRIGAILPLTGRAGMLGENVKNGMMMAAEDINAAGGIKGARLEISFGDSKNEPKEGVALMNRFTSLDRLPVVVSAMTPVTEPLIPLAERTKTVVFATMVSSPTFAERSPWLFRCFTRAETEVPPLAKIAYAQLKMRKAAAVYVDDDFGKGYADFFRAEFEKLGGKMQSELPYERGASDFRNTLIKLKGADIDGIYLVGYDKAMGLIPKQLREMGINTPLLANASMATPAYLEIAGDTADGTVLLNFAFSTQRPPTEQGKKLIARYKERFGEVPLVLTVIGYDIVRLIARAIETQGGSAEQIRDGLLGIKEFQGVIGKLTVQPNREVDVPLMPLIIRGGKPVPFAPTPKPSTATP